MKKKVLALALAAAMAVPWRPVAVLPNPRRPQLPRRRRPLRQRAKAEQGGGCRDHCG